MNWTLLFSLLLMFQQPAKERREDPSKFEPGALGMKVPVLTEKDDLDKYVGRLVAVRGIPPLQKVSHIAGVEVYADHKLKEDKVECYAVGILAKWVIKAEDLKPGIANSGPGTVYKLYSDLKGKSAEAKPVPTKSK